MKLVTIVIVYGGASGHAFMAGECVVAKDNEDVRIAAENLAAPLVADGFKVINQLYVTVPDDLIQCVAKAAQGET